MRYKQDIKNLRRDIEEASKELDYLLLVQNKEIRPRAIELRNLLNRLISLTSPIMQTFGDAVGERFLLDIEGIDFDTKTKQHTATDIARFDQQIIEYANSQYAIFFDREENTLHYAILEANEELIWHEIQYGEPLPLGVDGGRLLVFVHYGEDEPTPINTTESRLTHIWGGSYTFSDDTDPRAEHYFEVCKYGAWYGTINTSKENRVYGRLFCARIG